MLSVLHTDNRDKFEPKVSKPNGVSAETIRKSSIIELKKALN